MQLSTQNCTMHGHDHTTAQVKKVSLAHSVFFVTLMRDCGSRARGVGFGTCSAQEMPHGSFPLPKKVVFENGWLTAVRARAVRNGLSQSVPHGPHLVRSQSRCSSERGVGWIAGQWHSGKPCGHAAQAEHSSYLSKDGIHIGDGGRSSYERISNTVVIDKYQDPTTLKGRA